MDRLAALLVGEQLRGLGAAPAPGWARGLSSLPRRSSRGSFVGNSIVSSS